MFGDSDFRDSKITDPEKYFAFTPDNVQPPRQYYVLKEDLEGIKKGELPKHRMDFKGRGAAYYKNTDGRYGGTAIAAHFLFAPEVMEWLQSDPEFMRRCVDEGATAFLPKDVQDIFVF